MRLGLGFVLVGTLALAACAAAACGTSQGPNGIDVGDGGTGGNGDGGPVLLGGGDGGTGTQQLVIQPQNKVLDVSAPGVTLQFQALVNGTATTAQWSIDAAGVGTIDAKGLFTASGTLGGQIQINATAGALNASTGLTVLLHLTDNPGNVGGGTQGQLQGGGATDGGADPAFAWLYPYDATVFPRDMPSPTLQFGGTAFDAAMVKVSFSGLDYTGFYGPSTPGRVQFSPLAWSAITGSANGGDKVTVAVTKISAGVVSGPITETWTIAPGNLRGSIYYNSYNSALAAPPAGSGFPAQTGAVLKLRPGQPQPTVVIPTNANGECHVCHVVSASGNMMVAADEPNGASFTAADGVYDLTASANKLFDAPNRTWDFGALTPDGTKFLRYGAVPDQSLPGESWAPNVRGLGQSGDLPSGLFDPKTGNAIAAPGLDGSNLHMMMPTFSSDGKHVAFNHFDQTADGGGALLGHVIAVMDFDAATNTFSNLRDVATLPANLYAGWPTFTPDDQFLFFAGGTNAEYDTLSDDTSQVPQPSSEIYIAHIPSKTIATADALNGVAAGKVYLPFADDPHLNFEPTILPVASGGYYWVVFTTRRNYGNIVNGDPYTGPNGPSPRKKLWVAAIGITGASGEAPVTAATDLTHPAFYLDGQEVAAGNMRAFWALDPCQQNGTTCSTGDQCCSGFCRQTTEPDGALGFSCIAPPTGCSQENEKCTTVADCCGASQGYQCLNGFCARPSPR